jgi:GTP cyclohydrolase I
MHVRCRLQRRGGVSQPALSLAPVDPYELPDVQAEAPAIPIVLDEAGIADLRYPLVVQLTDGTSHATVATAALAVSVPPETRGVHMSRFVEVLHEWRERIGVDTVAALLADVADRLSSDAVVAKLAFPLFLERNAPVSGGRALVSYDCSLEGRLAAGAARCTLGTRVPITTLCPCSREISDYGAHNQRGTIELDVSFDLAKDVRPIDFGDLIHIAEEAGSAPIYSLLKRTDERSVTMQAYENPAFVEDIARAVAVELQRGKRIRAGRVRVVNEESIHTHNAYAAVRWTTLTPAAAE